MVDNKKTDIFLQEEKNLFRQASITPAKKFYLWLILFAVVTGSFLLFLNGRISFGNIFACGVCLIVAVTWAVDGLKSKSE